MYVCTILCNECVCVYIESLSLIMVFTSIFIIYTDNRLIPIFAYS